MVYVGVSDAYPKVCVPCECRQGGSRMRSDAVLAQEAARRSAEAAEHDSFAQRQPSVRSVVQRVSSAKPDANDTAPEGKPCAR